jgi:hypothetical protein
LTSRAGIALADTDPRAAAVRAAAVRRHVPAVHDAAATRSQAVLVDLVESCIDDVQQVVEPSLAA